MVQLLSANPRRSALLPHASTTPHVPTTQSARAAGGAPTAHNARPAGGAPTAHCARPAGGAPTARSARPSRGSGPIRGLAVLVWLLVLAACGGGEPPGPPAPQNPMLPLPSDAVLYYDDRGGITESVRIVVMDEAEWTQAWEEATSRRAEPPPRPQVNFDTHMVLVAAAGRMTPGDRIQVDSAGVRTERTTEDEEEVFEVVVRTVEGCGELRSDIHPLTIVRLPRFEGRVSFEERDVQRECSTQP